MAVRIVVTKATGNGEQVQIDIPSWNPVTGEIEFDNVAQMSQKFDEVMATVDLRMEEMNLRLLECNNLEQYCNSDTWVKIVDILDILAGRQNADTVRRRWQSSIEETAALEADRQAATEAQYLGRAEDTWNGKEY